MVGVMGASGHVLGERKKAWLSRKIGMEVAHAIRGYYGNKYDVRVRTDECRHYVVDDKSFDIIEGPILCHGEGWTSCRDWYESNQRSKPAT